MYAHACIHSCGCVRAGVVSYMHVCSCMHPCTCVRACVRACERASVRACMRAWMRALACSGDRTLGCLHTRANLCVTVRGRHLRHPYPHTSLPSPSHAQTHARPRAPQVWRLLSVACSISQKERRVPWRVRASPLQRGLFQDGSGGCAAHRFSKVLPIVVALQTKYASALTFENFLRPCRSGGCAGTIEPTPRTGCCCLYYLAG